MTEHAIPGHPGIQFDSLHSDEEAADPVEDEHRVIFACPECTHAEQRFLDLFQSSVVSVDQFLNLPDCDHVAIFHTQVKIMHENLASLMGLCQAPNRIKICHHHLLHHCIRIPSYRLLTGGNFRA